MANETWEKYHERAEHHRVNTSADDTPATSDDGESAVDRQGSGGPGATDTPDHTSREESSQGERAPPQPDHTNSPNNAGDDASRAGLNTDGEEAEERGHAADKDEETPEYDRNAPLAATVSARNAVLRGEPSAPIIRRIGKQWPGLRAQAPDIERKARLWADKLQPGQLVKVDGIARRITSLEPCLSGL